jgi:hypothetical protein
MGVAVRLRTAGKRPCACAVRITACAAAALSALSPFGVGAGDAHVHGAATLQIAVDGNRLTLDFMSPLDNLAGFEHAPQTEKQKVAARDMVKRLRAPELLFAPTAEAQCQPGAVNLESAVLGPALLTGAAASVKPDSETRSGKGAVQAARGGHASISGEFVFTCSRPQALSGLELKAFDVFPRLKRVDVQVAGAKKQNAARLTPTSRRIAF